MTCDYIVWSLIPLYLWERLLLLPSCHVNGVGKQSALFWVDIFTAVRWCQYLQSGRAGCGLAQLTHRFGDGIPRAAWANQVFTRQLTHRNVNIWSRQLRELPDLAASTWHDEKRYRSVYFNTTKIDSSENLSIFLK